jgi:hypothetical protein
MRSPAIYLGKTNLQIMFDTVWFMFHWDEHVPLIPKVRYNGKCAYPRPGFYASVSFLGFSLALLYLPYFRCTGVPETGMYKTITVTKSDIEKGERGERRKCPVALALQRELKDPSIIVGSNGPETAMVTNEDMVFDGKWITLPGPIAEAIHNYDAGAEFEPTTFQILWPGKISW